MERLLAHRADQMNLVLCKVLADDGGIHAVSTRDLNLLHGLLAATMESICEELARREAAVAAHGAFGARRFDDSEEAKRGDARSSQFDM